MRKNKVKKHCPFCDKDFETLNPTKVTFCSRECANLSRRKLNTCECCGSKFFKKEHRTKTCSPECYTVMKNSNKKDKICLSCDKHYQVSSCFEQESKYCSYECYWETRRTGQKMNCKCSHCDKEFYKAPSLQKLHTNNFCSALCMGQYYSENKLFSGQNSGTWQGGKINYYGRNWSIQKKLARKRDNYECQDCGIREEDYGKNLSVNHKIPFVCFSNYKEANELENLECLCEPCHRKWHSGDNHPSKFKDTYKEYFDLLNR